MPWIWALPGLLALAVFLVYPSIDTFRRSLMNSNSTEFVGLESYARVFVKEETQLALLNSLLWMIVFTGVTTALGLLIAVMLERVRYDVVIKTLVFLPMAISFTAAAVIWRFVYGFQPTGFPQWGAANAALTTLGFDSHPFLISKEVIPFYGINNVAVIVAAVWMTTGFAMMVFSAAIRGLPQELLEAARVDGAKEWQVFWHIIRPSIMPTIYVVATVLVISALKVFDLVFVMTGGLFETDVVANRMYKEMFEYREFGIATALSVILLFLSLPVIAINIQRFRRHERER